MNKGKTNGKAAGNNSKREPQAEDLPTNAGYGDQNPKLDDLSKNIEDSGGEFLTTSQGVRVNDNQNSLKAGDRGPSLKFVNAIAKHRHWEREPAL